MDTHIVLLAQIFAFGDAVRNVVAGDITQQVNRARSELLWAEFFGWCVDGVANPINDFQAVIEFFLFFVVQYSPVHFTGAFWRTVTLPECPAFLDIPAITRQLYVLQTLAVNFTCRTLD